MRNWRQKKKPKLLVNPRLFFSVWKSRTKKRTNTHEDQKQKPGIKNGWEQTREKKQMVLCNEPCSMNIKFLNFVSIVKRKELTRKSAHYHSTWMLLLAAVVLWFDGKGSLVVFLSFWLIFSFLAWSIALLPWFNVCLLDGAFIFCGWLHFKFLMGIMLE